MFGLKAIALWEFYFLSLVSCQTVEASDSTGSKCRRLEIPDCPVLVTSPHRVADAIAPVLAQSDLSPRKKILVPDIVDNFELLRAAISCTPTKVPTLPFLYAALRQAEHTIGLSIPEIATKARAGVVKALIQYSTVVISWVRYLLGENCKSQKNAL